MTEYQAANLQLGSVRGLLVRAVAPNGAASAAGLVTGDVILSFGQSQIGTISEMAKGLQSVQPNTRVSALVWRDRHEVPLTINF